MGMLFNGMINIKNGILPKEQFKKELLIRFRPSEYENVDGQLVKIR